MNQYDYDTIRIQIKLSPNSSRDAIQGWAEDTNGEAILKCTVTAVPENGKANTALIKMLSKTFCIPKSAICLIKGETSRHKTLEIRGGSADLLPPKF